MRFALVGDHADGLAVIRALTATGNHQLVLYGGPILGAEYLKRFGLEPLRKHDLEEILAIPDIDALVIASPPAVRGVHLRRALQSEHHVLCVHPCAPSADLAYEMALIQGDTRRLLMPILPLLVHPAWQKLREITARSGAARILEFTWIGEGDLFLPADEPEPRPELPGWELWRLLAGEIVEIFAQTPAEDVLPDDALAVSGRFASGTLLHGTFLPRHHQTSLRIRMVFAQETWEMEFPDGWPGPARLRGPVETLEYPTFDPWPGVAQMWDSALAALPVPKPGQLPAQSTSACLTSPTPRLTWLDEIRGLELDDNVRRSLRYRRAYLLDLQEASEEASFKGTMTLVGCSLIWIMLLWLILAVWLPWMAWLILPTLAIFLGLQFLGYAVPAKGKSEDESKEK